jgi:hypothetical protein
MRESLIRVSSSQDRALIAVLDPCILESHLYYSFEKMEHEHARSRTTAEETELPNRPVVAEMPTGNTRVVSRI